MNFSGFKKPIAVLGLAAVMFMVAAAIFILVKEYKKPVIAGFNVEIAQKNREPIYSPPQKLINPPKIINGIYVTGYSAGAKKYLDYLENLFKNTEINAVVVDIKPSDGYVTYNSGAPDVQKYGLSNNAIKDIDSLVKFFHDKNIYVIGRISVFEDPVYSKVRPDLAIYNKTRAELALSSQTPYLPESILWKDNNGLSWLDPASEEVWDYIVSLAKDAFYHGFDEINFDYIRFPSDGNLEEMGFPVWDGATPKVEVIKNFFAYLRKNLPEQKISADVFGQTTTNKDDMGIGQLIENTFENFDYVSPMVYPSHYITNFMGFLNPAEHPYEIVNYSMATALNRKKVWDVSVSEEAPASKAKFRPWLQDFNMGADYNAEMVKLEIEAVKNALGQDYAGFMLWNPYNIYTREAILKPN